MDKYIYKIKNNIEVIKDWVLWILFISSIALIVIRYNLISYSNPIDVNMKISNVEDIMEDIIRPSHIIIKFNQYDITQILQNKSKYYPEIKNNLSLALKKTNTLKKIPEDEFLSSKKNPHISLIFKDIPSKYIENFLDIKKTAISDIGYIEEINFIFDINEILFKTKDSFFILKSEHINNFPTINDLSNQSYDKFYPIFENINPNTNIILPLKWDLKIKSLFTKNIIDDVRITDIARNIFKEKLDFTSSFIQQNGVYFYSYNNGQEILRVASDGYLEYKNDNLKNTQTDLETATKIVLVFLKDLGFSYDTILIDSVNTIEENSRLIYDFSIKNIKDDIEISMHDIVKNGHIQVSGKNVINANLYLRYPQDYSDDGKYVLEPSKALNLQISFIKNTLKVQDVQNVISKIKNIDMIYMMNDDYELEIAWKFYIGNYIFVLNASTGEVMNYAMV